MTEARRACVRGLTAQGRHVGGHVGGAPQPARLVVEGDDRNRGLGRDARHAADDEGVDHGVAHDEDVESGAALEDFGRRAETVVFHGMHGLVVRFAPDAAEI